MSRHYDHIDLRVRNLAEVSEFYETLLPALGFTRDARIAGWLQYEAIAPNGGVGEFFGVTEPARHMPNENRVAFWAERPAEVNRLAEIATRAGVRNVEVPRWKTQLIMPFFSRTRVAIV